MIIALGLNDVKNPYNLSAKDIQQHCKEFVDIVKTRPQSIPAKKRKCILIAPNLTGEDCQWVEFSGANDKINQLCDLYSNLTLMRWLIQEILQ